MIKLKPLNWTSNRRERAAIPAGSTLYWITSTWVISLILLFICFYLKRLELEQYRPDTFRLILTCLSGLMLFFSSFAGLAYLLDKIAFEKQWNLKEQKYYGLAALTLFLLFALSALIYGFNSNGKLEENALAEHGKIQKHLVKRVEYSPGKNSHYKFYFQVNNPSIKLDDLYVQRPAKLFNVGDTITLKILPQNPTVCRLMAD